MKLKTMNQIPRADLVEERENLELATVIRQALEHLPRLPPSVRYYDDFAGAFHTLSNFDEAVTFEFTINGRRRYADMTRLPRECVALVRHLVFDWIGRLDSGSALQTFLAVIVMGTRVEDLLSAALTLPIVEFRNLWVSTPRFGANHYETRAMKQILFSLCNLSVHPWGAEWKEYVEDLPSARVDKYKAVQTGDCFMPVEQQALIVDYFDEVAALVQAAPAQVTTDDLKGACMLVLALQHGFRRGQIARVERGDVRVFPTGAVHVRVLLTKKRNGPKRHIVRRIKREWCPLFVELLKHRDRGAGVRRGVRDDLLFSLRPDEVTYRIDRLCRRITGSAWNVTDLRHTAAQRQVDAGASHVEVSEFLGQDSIRTANIYFGASATQAERVNTAMALSPIYSKVAEVARTRTIDKAALLALPSDEQIGGAPHGIPIAGIGACTLGQSRCKKNPVVSCYTCRRFHPVNDVEIHQQVASDLRPVVREFFDAGRGNEEVPAYTQLSGTLHAVERVIADIDPEGNADNGNE